jgi:hypothetical protein
MVFMDLLKTVIQSIQRTLVSYATDDHAEGHGAGSHKAQGDEPLVVVVCDGQIAEAFATFKTSNT